MKQKIFNRNNELLNYFFRKKEKKKSRNDSNKRANLFVISTIFSLEARLHGRFFSSFAEHTKSLHKLTYFYFLKIRGEKIYFIYIYIKFLLLK